MRSICIVERGVANGMQVPRDAEDGRSSTGQVQVLCPSLDHLGQESLHVDALGHIRRAVSLEHVRSGRHPLVAGELVGIRRVAIAVTWEICPLRNNESNESWKVCMPANATTA